MPINVLALLPVLLLKLDKREKIGIAIRLYITSILFIGASFTIAAFFDKRFLSPPLWVLLLSCLLFMIALSAYARYSHKFLTKWKRRTLILASLLILYATKVSVVGYHLSEMRAFSIMWYISFIYALIAAYAATTEKLKYGSSYAGSTSATSQTRVDKSFAPQHEIDYDVHIKGKDVLNDPSAGLIERQRYIDALKKREDQQD